MKNGPEACDDANTNNTDNCLNSCQWNASCGDGVTQAFAGESCDDGNTSNTDTCLNSCAGASCGDGFLNGTEVCELSDPTCLATCGGFAVCGNGTTERGEVCDDGNTTNAGTCKAACNGYTTCGDGIVQTPNGGGQTEACDDGNTVNTDACTQSCAAPVCGDGYINGSEICDQGINNSNSVANRCRTSCIAPSCGDGVVDSSEMCDDNNATPGDGCNASCVIECTLDTDCNGNDACDTATNLCVSYICGNGTREGREECDDDNERS